MTLECPSSPRHENSPRDPYLPCLRENRWGKGRPGGLTSFIVGCRVWFTTRNSEDKKLLAPQMSEHYLKQKEQLTK